MMQRAVNTLRLHLLIVLRRLLLVRSLSDQEMIYLLFGPEGADVESGFCPRMLWDEALKRGLVRRTRQDDIA